MARRLTREERAILAAIEANRASIRQLRLANKALADLLPDFSAEETGAIRDPRTGEMIHYKNGRKKS